MCSAARVVDRIRSVMLLTRPLEVELLTGAGTGCAASCASPAFAAPCAVAGANAAGRGVCGLKIGGSISSCAAGVLRQAPIAGAARTEGARTPRPQRAPSRTDTGKLIKSSRRVMHQKNRWHAVRTRVLLTYSRVLPCSMRTRPIFTIKQHAGHARAAA